ncbi:hypothetical protein SBV1_660005 [Verrucomicrobia bacterium]|nr:hypothetical protein SBV1_660005 [Verrucomicrobiota bacterium]
MVNTLRVHEYMVWQSLLCDKYDLYDLFARSLGRFRPKVNPK